MKGNEINKVKFEQLYHKLLEHIYAKFKCETFHSESYSYFRYFFYDNGKSYYVGQAYVKINNDSKNVKITYFFPTHQIRQWGKKIGLGTLAHMFMLIELKKKHGKKIDNHDVEYSGISDDLEGQLKAMKINPKSLGTFNEFFNNSMEYARRKKVEKYLIPSKFRLDNII